MARSKVKKLFFSAILLLLDPRDEIRESEIRDPGSRIGIEKIRIRNPGQTPRIRNTPFHMLLFTELLLNLFEICPW
jgi:hypothetical protein